MQISIYTLILLLCTSLFAPVAMAQEQFTAPDKEHRQGMSYEEYSQFREKMRMRMEKMHQERLEQNQESADRPAQQTERTQPDNAYGKGYHSRNRAEDRPDAGPDRQPERPRFERFNRGDMMRR